jgi:E3 ubiquitin-protein ligase synoviolin
MHILKSKFYFCLALNFFIMLLVILGKFLIYLFYGEVRLSELTKVLERVRIKFYNLLVLFITFRPTIDIKKIFFVSLYFFMAFLTGIAYKRGAYITSSNEIEKSTQIKIIFIYIFLIYLNYLLYTVSLTTNEQEKNLSHAEFLIYYVFNCEFLFLFIKIVAKFYKLMINITSINMDKIWDYRNLTFNVISSIKYAIKILCEFRFCYVLIRMRIFPIYFFIDVLKNAYHLIKMPVKIYESYNNANYIQSLMDYDINTELKNLGLINDHMTEEEKEKIKQDKIDRCNICLYELEKGKYLNCGHAFHLKCIRSWVSQNAKCPLCKSNIKTDQNIHSRFLNERLGIRGNNNINNNNQNNANANVQNNINNNNSNIKRTFTNEELLERIDLTHDYNNNFISYKKYNFEETLDENPTLKKFLDVKKIQNKLNILKEKIGEKNDNNDTKKVETGAISYGLPTEAIYDRKIENEVKRLEIELVNQKLLKMYESPKESLINFINQNQNNK